MRQPFLFLVEEIRVDQGDRLGVQRLEQRIGIDSFSCRDVGHLLDLRFFAILLGGSADRLHIRCVIDNVGHVRVFAHQEAYRQQKLHLKIKMLVFLTNHDFCSFEKLDRWRDRMKPKRNGVGRSLTFKEACRTNH